MSGLVLSLFPGLDLLGRAFEEEGYTVVRGPDLIFGGDIRTFHPPPGRFDGVIGGPPCQIFSAMRRLNPACGQKHGNLIPEFERVVAEAQPQWFVMENVPHAPEPVVADYQTHSLVLNNRWLGEEQERTRRFTLGTPFGARLVVDVAAFESLAYTQAVTSASRRVPVKLAYGTGGVLRPKRTYTEEGKRHGPDRGPRLSIADMLRLQGAPPDMLDESPWTESGKRKAIGNGVPLPMGRAIARAVKRALQSEVA